MKPLFLFGACMLVFFQVFAVPLSPEDSLRSSVTRALNARTIRETETGHHFRFYFACLSVSLYFACFHFWHLHLFLFHWLLRFPATNVCHLLFVVDSHVSFSTLVCSVSCSQQSWGCRPVRHICKEKPRRASNCQPAHCPACTAPLIFWPCPALQLPLQMPQVQPLLFTFEEHLSHFLSSLDIVFKFCCALTISKLELFELHIFNPPAVLRGNESSNLETVISNLISPNTNVPGYVESSRSSPTIFDRPPQKGFWRRKEKRWEGSGSVGQLCVGTGGLLVVSATVAADQRPRTATLRSVTPIHLIPATLLTLELFAGYSNGEYLVAIQ